MHTATASYRLLPEITLTKPVIGANAKKLAKCFAKGVVKVVKGEDGESRARVVDPRRDTCSREVLRHKVKQKGNNKRMTLCLCFKKM